MAHTTVMFSIVTIYNTTNLGLQSLSYIDNREFKCPGSEDGTSGPSSYGYFTSNKPISVVPFMMFTLNYWLADGLLVSPMLSLVVQVPNVGCTSSSIAAILSMP